MRTYVKATLGTLAALAAFQLGNLALAVPPVTDSNRYETIVERNLFGLRPAVASPGESATPPPPPKIFLTGITTILGNKRALLKVMLPSRPGEPAREESYILTEGQREGNVEVVKIDERLGLVKVNDYGRELTLSFDKDGLRPTAAAPTDELTIRRSVTPRFTNPGWQRLPTRGANSSGNTPALPPDPTGNASIPAVSQPPTTPPISLPADFPTGQLTAAEQRLLLELERNPASTISPPAPTAPTQLPGQGPSIFRRLPLSQ